MATLVVMSLVVPGATMAARADEPARLGIDAAEWQAEPGAPQGGVMRVRFAPESRDRFHALTQAHIGEIAVVAIDGRVVARPRILTAMAGGAVSIMGLERREAEILAPRLIDGRSVLTVAFEAVPPRR